MIRLNSRSAVISPCGTYRYRLTRKWSDRPKCWWIMLNPSTADGTTDDPTIRRVISFSRYWGYGGCVVMNLFALRATDPKAIWRHEDPVGPENDEYLRHAINAPLVIAAWGANDTRGRDRQVLYLLKTKTIYCLEMTKAKRPKHPLYVKISAEPILFN